MPHPLRVLELFCGIGGGAVALGERAEVAAAVDISEPALRAYRYNFPTHRTLTRTIESLQGDDLAAYEADLWWLSPPCQPFTRRGLGRDLDDPRSAGLLRILDLLADDRFDALRPRYLALENVGGFETSRAAKRLRGVLGETGYHLRERLLCPSELGMPSRRPRYYMIAARHTPFGPWRDEPVSTPLASCLDPRPDPALSLAPDTAHRYRHALDRVSADDVGAVTACFTSAYGRSPVRSGSYLEQGDGLRRFSPGEILRLLGFPASFRLPPDLPRDKAWRLVGNSLSVPAVQAVLRPIFDLADRGRKRSSR
ncbi:MAG: DNA cytosine methyltransferase [Acidobacteriota bacterium]